jgi:hypothetical protein
MLSSSFSLSWSAVERADGYLIDISTDNYSTYKNDYFEYSTTGNILELTNLDQSVLWYSRIKSYTAYEESDYSTTTGYTLSLPPTGFVVDDLNPSGFILSWLDIESDLIASYNFIGNYIDSSGNGYDLTPSSTEDVTSGFLRITSGTTEHLYVPTGVVNGLTDFTFSCWLKFLSMEDTDITGNISRRELINGYTVGLNSSTSSFRILAETFEGSTSGNIIFEALTPALLSSLPITGTTGNDYLTNGYLSYNIGDFDTNRHHLAVTRDTTGFVTLYLDGVQITSLDGDDSGQYFSDAISCQELVIGNRQTSLDTGYNEIYSLNGDIDTIRIYSRCLLEDEINRLMDLYTDISET